MGAPGTNGTNFTSANSLYSKLSPKRRTTINRWVCSPTGITITPPSASCCNNAIGIVLAAAVTKYHQMVLCLPTLPSRLHAALTHYVNPAYSNVALLDIAVRQFAQLNTHEQPTVPI